jgi:hypothetical protein
MGTHSMGKGKPNLMGKGTKSRFVVVCHVFPGICGGIWAMIGPLAIMASVDRRELAIVVAIYGILALPARPMDSPSLPPFGRTACRKSLGGIRQHQPSTVNSRSRWDFPPVLRFATGLLLLMALSNGEWLLPVALSYLPPLLLS